MHNQGNYGYPSQFPTSSGQTSDSWKNSNGNRNDSWRTPTPSNEHWRRPEDNFRYGIDRAPNNIDEQFLIRIGAKRLNNGNLVDRNGYTLRQRDFQCSAPSPPTINPGREERKSRLSPFSQKELEERTAKQKNLMKKQEKMKEKQRRYLENRRKREEEGADEYEEVEPEPKKVTAPLPAASIAPAAPVAQKAQNAAPGARAAPIPYQRPLRPPIPTISKQKEWYNEYQQDIEKRKAMIYGNSMYSTPTSSGSFFPFTSSFPTTSSAPPPAPYIALQPNVAFTSEIPRKPPQMALPPPGIVEMKTPPKTVKKSENLKNFYEEAELYVPPPTSSDVNPFGIRIGAPIVQRQSETSSSESEEEEAIRKLKEIIKTYGPN